MGPCEPSRFQLGTGQLYGISWRVMGDQTKPLQMCYAVHARA